MNAPLEIIFEDVDSEVKVNLGDLSLPPHGVGRHDNAGHEVGEVRKSG